MDGDLEKKALQAIRDGKGNPVGDNPSMTDDTLAPLKSPSSQGKRLTPKKLKFAQCLIEGMTAADAYRVAYNAESMAETSIRTEAWKLANDVLIQEIVERERAKMVRASTVSVGGLRPQIIERLWSEAQNARQDGARIRALELLGKMPEIDLFGEHNAGDKSERRDVGELTRQIKAELKKLGLDAKVIDS